MRFAGWIACLGLATSQIQTSVAASAVDEAKIRSIVMDVLKEKDKQIGGLEQRVKELEALAESQKDTIQQLQTAKVQAVAGPNPSSDKSELAKAAVEKPARSESPLAKLILPSLKKKEEEAKAAAEAEESGPKVGGWMEMSAQTKNKDNTVFHIGIVELDLDKVVETEHFALSAALDWFPYGTTPNAQIGVGLVDFHMYDDAVPVRGRIFQEPGFHLQLGQFDLPFAADYQFFASTDRLTITPPYTTTRMQMSGVNPANGGFNSTGIRSYGVWKNFTYAVYWVESLFDSDPYFHGGAAGGRVGYQLTNPYRLHKRSDLPILDVGVSALVDMNDHEHTGDNVYAADISMSYGMFRMINELLLRDSQANRNQATVGLADEYGFHNTLVFDLESWLDMPLKAYGRYQEWHPRYQSITTDVDGCCRVRPLRGVSVGLNYQINHFIKLKLEYNDSLDTYTDEPSFQKRFGIAELVASF